MVTAKKSFVSVMFHYGFLNILGSLGFSIYIFADTFFMAKGLGADGLTALNLILPGCTLISALAIMFSTGASTRFAVLQGQGEYEEANRIFSLTAKAGLIIGILLMIVGLFASESIVLLLGADEVILPLSATYLRTFLSFSPAFILNSIMISFVRCDGSPKLSTVAMITGSLINTLLDIIFIFGLNWGMFGAAFSSGLAPIISLSILSIHKIKGRNTFKLIKTKFDFAGLFRICGLGMSAFISDMSAGIIMLIFNFVILKLSGNIGVAAYGIIANLAIIAAAVFNGLTNGIQPLISRAYGEGNHKHIRQALIFLLCGSLILGILFYATGLLFPTEIARVFDRDGNQQLIAMGSDGIKYYFLAFVFMGLNIAVSGYMTAKEQAKKAFAISILRGGIVIIPVVLILSHFWGITGVWLAAPVTEFIILLLAIGVLLHSRKKSNQTIAALNSAEA